jgi:hypothetical protein
MPDVASGRVYISRDVVFNENVSPFTQLHSNAGAHLHSEIALLSPTLLQVAYDQGGEIMGDHMLNLSNANNSSDGHADKSEITSADHRVDAAEKDLVSNPCTAQVQE